MHTCSLFVHVDARHHPTLQTQLVITFYFLLFVTGAFLICWGPYVLLNVWSVNNKTQPIPYKADLITTLLVMANSAINPFVLILLTRDLRMAVRMLLVHFLDILFPSDDITNVSGRRFSRQRDSMVDTIRGTSRASFDSGVEVDRDHSGSSRRSLTSGTPIPRVMSTITLRCDSMESDDDETEREPIATTSADVSCYDATSYVTNTQTQELQGDILFMDHSRKYVFVSQFGTTLKPTDAFNVISERKQQRRPANPHECERQKIIMSSHSYGAIDADDTHEHVQLKVTLEKQWHAAETNVSSGDRCIPLLVLPGDDSE